MRTIKIGDGGDVDVDSGEDVVIEYNDVQFFVRAETDITVRVNRNGDGEFRVMSQGIVYNYGDPVSTDPDCYRKYFDIYDVGGKVADMVTDSCYWDGDCDTPGCIVTNRYDMSTVSTLVQLQNAHPNLDNEDFEFQDKVAIIERGRELPSNWVNAIDIEDDYEFRVTKGISDRVCNGSSLNIEAEVLDGTLDGSFTGLLTVDNLLTGDSQETIINGDTNIDIEVDIPEVGVSGETEVIKAELN